MLRIEQTLHNLGLPVQVLDWYRAPQVYRVRLQPSRRQLRHGGLGVVTKVASLRRRAEDLAIGLGVASVTVTTDASGLWLEIARPDREFIPVMACSADGVCIVPVVLGQAVTGETLTLDLAKPSTPHLLVAGATGSGKTMLLKSIVYGLAQSKPAEDVKFIIIDTKHELTSLVGLAHVVTVVSEPTTAFRLLATALGIARDRYRDHAVPWPRYVILIDEYADLVLQDRNIEKLIISLASIGRAVGIHLILATQRPSVDVVTGLIKANFPVRVSFTLPSRYDSKTILDRPGAEVLLGCGDGLLLTNGGYIERFQGAYVEDEDLQRLVAAYPKPPAQKLHHHRGLLSRILRRK